MFKPQDSVAFGQGTAALAPLGAGGPQAAARVFGRAPQAEGQAAVILPFPQSARHSASPADASGHDATQASPRWHARLNTLAQAHDLAEDIGSRAWYRGLGKLGVLTLAALAFWPNFSALEAAPASRLDAEAQREYRTQAMAALNRADSPSPRPAPAATLRAVAYVPERPRVELAPVLPAGETLARTLLRAGVAGPDADRASALIATAMPLADLPIGTRVALVLGPRPAPGQPRPLERAELRARLDLTLAISRVGGGGLVLQRQTVPVDTTPLRIRGMVGESLYRSARAAGAPPSAIQEYLQALDAHVSLESDVAPGDTFDLVFASRRAATGETEVGNLLYAGLDRQTPTGPRPIVELLRWGQDGGFYSAAALARPSYVQSGTGMLAPVNGHLTSTYGQRFHPILGYARMHAGVDFGAAWGSPIVATAPGVVAYAGPHGGHGNYVRLEHGGGLGTGYAHMSRIAVGPGERVSAGEVIGYVGSTGLSTGPHLHYEMYQNGRTVNPLGVRFATMVRQVDTRELGAFRAKLAQFRALRPGGSGGLAYGTGRMGTTTRIALR